MVESVLHPVETEWRTGGDLGPFSPPEALFDHSIISQFESYFRWFTPTRNHTAELRKQWQTIMQSFCQDCVCIFTCRAFDPLNVTQWNNLDIYNGTPRASTVEGSNGNTLYEGLLMSAFKRHYDAQWMHQTTLAKEKKSLVLGLISVKDVSLRCPSLIPGCCLRCKKKK